MRFLQYISVFILLLSSCSGAEFSTLNLADAIMEEDPDSALNILLSIDRNKISNRDIPYYALLMTQAMVKTDVQVASDSLISIAYKKFSDDWWDDKGIRSSFYVGEVFYNQEKPRDAMKYYLSTYEEAKRLRNHYWHAKAAERIADLFFNAYNYGEAAKYRKEAIEYFGKADRVINQRYAVADLANDNINDSRYEEAIVILDSICNQIDIDSFTNNNLNNYIKRTRIDALTFLGRINELDKKDLELLDIVKSEKDRIDAEIFRVRFLELQDSGFIDTDRLKTLSYSATSDEDKALTYYACYLSAKSSGNMEIMSTFMDSVLLYQNNIFQDIIRESVTSAERDFYIEAAVRNRKLINNLFIYITIVVLLTIGVVFITWRFRRLKDLTRKAELEANVEALVSLKSLSDKLSTEKTALSILMKIQSEEITKLQQHAESLTAKSIELEQQSHESRRSVEEIKKKHNTEIERQNKILVRLFKEKWSTLRMLCEEYYEKGSSQKLRETIQKNIEIEVKNIGSSAGLSQIEEETDRYLNGIVSKLRIECPNLKEKDVQLCCLIFAGFSVKAICFILNITSNNFYVRKKRVTDKIKLISPPLKDVFIGYLQ